MEDLVSVIIMIYNNKKYLKEAIDSVLMQDYKNMELIISDDYSNDFSQKDLEETIEYIEENKKDNIVRYTVSQNHKNIGVIRNYNKCITLSSGQYIMYLSADDNFYDENVVSDVVNFLKKSGYLITTSFINAYSNDKENGDKLLYLHYAKKAFTGNPRDLYVALAHSTNFIPGASTYFTRDLIKTYGLYDYAYCNLEDFPRYLSLTRRGCPIGLFDRYTINYRLGGITTQNTSATSTSEQKENIKIKLFTDQIVASNKEVTPYLDSIMKFPAYYYNNIQKSSILELSKQNIYSLSLYVTAEINPEDESKLGANIEIKPYQKYINLKIDLSKYKNISNINIGLLNCPCAIKLHDIYTINNGEKISIPITNTNCDTTCEDIIFFGCNSPSISIDLPKVNLDDLYLNYEFVSYDTVLL